MSIFLVVLIVGIGGLIYGAINYLKIINMKEGTKQMSQTSAAIRLSSDTFLYEEYKIIAITVAAIAIIVGAFIEVSAAVAFLIGIFMSGLAGFVNMKASTRANVRVTNTALETQSLYDSLKTALRGGSIAGLSVASFALIGLAVVFFIFHEQFEHLGSVTNWCGIEFEPFSMTLFSYSLGCSVIAMFARVGGGIFTKAADMGADLVGKTELNIPEDDHRNPAVIADCAGDNVGDTAGLGSDLLESYMGAIVSGMTFIIFLFRKYAYTNLNFSQSLFEKLFFYPAIFVTIGLVSCIIGLLYVFSRKGGSNPDPHRELNIATWISAGLTGVLNLIATIILFVGEDIGDLPFALGGFSPYFSAVLGIAAGIAIGRISEYYTSEDFKPTQKIAEVSKEGPAIVVTQGLATGMKSTLLSAGVLAAALLISILTSGFFGAAMAGIGMLSFVTITVSVDTYGPISDNAGGIAEMCHLPENVRKITDKLDSVGNTTAAMGKGFAIGSANFAAVALMISFMYSFTPLDQEVVLNALNVFTFAGLIVGGAIPFYFSGLLTESVSKTAALMVDEVRRQWDEIPGLAEGATDPDYQSCVKISTQGALKEMRTPALIAVLTTVVSGFVFGPNFVAGILLGTTFSSIFLAIFCGNSGGAWDNAKKSNEAKGLKGSLEHIATVVGDMIGDPLKDTVGPSLDILVKIMSVVSLIMVSIFKDYNLVNLITGLFK